MGGAELGVGTPGAMGSASAMVGREISVEVAATMSANVEAGTATSVEVGVVTLAEAGSVMSVGAGRGGGCRDLVCWMYTMSCG